MKKTTILLAALLISMICASAYALDVTGYESDSVEREWETNLFFERMQKLTGIEVSAHGVSDEKEYAALLADMQAGEVKADVLFKANLSRAQEIDLLNSGAIVDLAPLIEAHMPNLSALLAENPERRAIISLEDGRIASLPLINRAERQVMVWINKAWLEKLGISMPQSLEELTKALVAIRDGDPNGNYKNDEIPMDVLGVYEMRWLLPFFGIVADDYHLARNEHGQIVFAPEMPAYRTFIEQLKAWRSMGLMREDAFTGVHSSTLLETQEEDRATVSGLMVGAVPYSLAPIDSTMDYEPLLLAGPDGRIRWRDLLGDTWTGCYAVTSACEDPAQALRWVDALYTQEGASLAYGGEEGVDYSYDEDGKWSYIVSDERTMNSIRAQSLMYTGTAMPGLSPEDFLMKVNSDADVHVLEATKKAAAVAERVTRAYCLGEANQARADELALVLGELVDTGIARFVTGETELTDETYAAWLDELRAAGSEELTALFTNL